MKKATQIVLGLVLLIPAVLFALYGVLWAVVAFALPVVIGGVVMAFVSPKKKRDKDGNWYLGKL